MKIGLVDVDGKGNGFPNLALMKISAYHKSQGDEVEWANPLKEGKVQAYRDVDDIAVDGRTNLILMDNNILASERDLFYHSESGLEVAFEDGEWMHTINIHEYTIHTISGVHHIQHLLRLYGCEKEINL